jgi:hypothetical protein
MTLTWRELHSVILHKTEDELKDMIIKECETFKRPTILRRLHQRFTIVRAAREREELLGPEKRKTVFM